MAVSSKLFGYRDLSSGISNAGIGPAGPSRRGGRPFIVVSCPGSSDCFQPHLPGEWRLPPRSWEAQISVLEFALPPPWCQPLGLILGLILELILLGLILRLIPRSSLAPQ